MEKKHLLKLSIPSWSGQSRYRRLIPQCAAGYIHSQCAECEKLKAFLVRSGTSQGGYDRLSWSLVYIGIEM